MLVTRGGIPLDYELYPGNTYEGDTLCRALDGITERYDVSRVTVVADAGLFSRSNLEWLRERNLPYIVGFRAKNATRKLKEQILDADGYEGYRFDQDGEAQYSCKIIARGEERIIATYSKKRARKDRHSRERALEKLLKRLKRRGAKRGYVFPALQCLPSAVAHRTRISHQQARSEDPTDLSLDKPAHPSPYRHLFHGLLLCAAHESPAPGARTSDESGIDATRTEPPAGQHSGKPPRRPQIRDAEQRVGASQTNLSLRESQVEHHTV